MPKPIKLDSDGTFSELWEREKQRKLRDPINLSVDHAYPNGLPQPKFVALKSTVVRADQQIARAASSTLARRIANALNRYVPGPKGY